MMGYEDAVQKWGQGDHAQLVARLDAAEKDLLAVMTERDQLVALVKALPKMDGEIVVEGTDVTWDYGKSACMDTREEAEAYAALLQARKELGG